MEEEKNYRVEKKVIIELISKIVKEVDGVYSIKKGILGKDIKIKETPEGPEIFLGLIVKRGTSVPVVVEELQRKIKQELEKTLTASVKKINIAIKGIKFSS